MFVQSEEKSMKKQISTELEAMFGVITVKLLIMEKILRKIMYLNHLIVHFSYKTKSKCSTNQL